MIPMARVDTKQRYMTETKNRGFLTAQLKDTLAYSPKKKFVGGTLTSVTQNLPVFYCLREKKKNFFNIALQDPSLQNKHKQ